MKDQTLQFIDNNHSKFKGKHVLIGVCGSIATYKTISLVRLLQSYGCHVRIIVTKASLRFVGITTWKTLVKQHVYCSIWEEEKEHDTGVLHVSLAKWTDILLIAPITANTLSQLATGACHSLLNLVYFSLDKKPIIIAPAMDHAMWNHPAIQRQCLQISSDGAIIIPPEKGILASGIIGDGRLAKIPTIINYLYKSLISADNTKKLKSIHVLITLGGTKEPIDSVRYIGNYSSGKMGWAMVDAFYNDGASITVISTVPTPNQYKNIPSIMVIHVQEAQEMYHAVMEHSTTNDVIVMVAAVGDFKVSYKSKEKIHKDQIHSLTLQLEKNPDILFHLGQHKHPHQTLIGFTLDSDKQHAIAKIKRKQSDFMVFNDYRYENQGFQSVTNAGCIIGSDLKELEIPLITKYHMAYKIVHYCLATILCKYKLKK